MRYHRYHGEWALLALVALTALSFAYGANWPDISRLGLTQSLVLDGSVRIDRYERQTGDKSFFDGHWYSDKAPGNSFLAVPTFEAMRVSGLARQADERTGIWHRRGLLIAVRILTGGLGFLAVVFLAGRAAEALRHGSGVLAAATVGLATISMPLAATMLGHLAAAALAFWAFVSASQKRPVVAGGAAALAVVFDYQAALAGLVVLFYLVWQARSIRSVLLFLVGAVPPAALLGAYNTVAFGSPRHLSYRYVALGYGQHHRAFEGQHRGFFGIASASPETLLDILVGRRGLLTFSPVLVLAAAGLFLLWRRGLKAEALVCSVIAVTFIYLDAAYWDPLGGLSPGPRFVATAVPFLACGLPEAYRHWPRLTAAAALASVGGMVYQAATWGPNYDFSTIWWWAGLPRPVGVLLTLVPCAAAIALAGRGLLQFRRRAAAISVSQAAG